MDATSLAKKAEALEAKRRMKVEGEAGIGVRLDLLYRLTDELNADKDLAAIFGSPVSSKLAVFSNGKDISIVDAGIIKIDEEQKLKFLMRLKTIYERTLDGVG
ncbi:MAG: hypothetical protein V1875_06090 [Candidatus Altiarchaeota archaeon]